MLIFAGSFACGARLAVGEVKRAAPHTRTIDTAPAIPPMKSFVKGKFMGSQDQPEYSTALKPSFMECGSPAYLCARSRLLRKDTRETAHFGLSGLQAVCDQSPVPTMDGDGRVARNPPSFRLRLVPTRQGHRVIR